MPRMSKKEKEEWQFFLDDQGRKAYNELCRKCIRDCKQSFRAVIIQCPKFRSKRSKECRGKHPENPPGHLILYAGCTM